MSYWHNPSSKLRYPELDNEMREKSKDKDSEAPPFFLFSPFRPGFESSLLAKVSDNDVPKS